jgi:hypothetical protein
MSQSATRYPISQLIASLMYDHGYAPVEFVQSLGYRNIERGLRRLEPWLEQGHGYERILKQIAAAYPNQVHDLENAVAARIVQGASGNVHFLHSRPKRDDGANRHFNLCCVRWQVEPDRDSTDDPGSTVGRAVGGVAGSDARVSD